MALHHFYWAGKERTVAIGRNPQNQLSLQFIDPEITRRGIEKITFAPTDGVQEILFQVDASGQEDLKEILVAMHNLVRYFSSRQ
ncbi:MAG TPA: hypothetical protein VGN63_15480 [Flavisolibacter sp.]|jgi:hypothetical protein|nr:hypothetical protein [Flavisolibacter sp.]